jgi:YD repeat-containing protein
MILGRPVTTNAYETGNNYAYGYNTVGQLSTVTAPGNRQRDQWRLYLSGS